MCPSDSPVQYDQMRDVSIEEPGYLYACIQNADYAVMLLVFDRPEVTFAVATPEMGRGLHSLLDIAGV